MEEAENITHRRFEIWSRYHATLSGLEAEAKLRLPRIPSDCQHNAHMYYILLADYESRSRAIEYLKMNEIHALFHYVPLHDSPAGRTLGRTSGDMAVTRRVADRLLRLPLWLGIEPSLPGICEKLAEFFESESTLLSADCFPFRSRQVGAAHMPVGKP